MIKTDWRRAFPDGRNDRILELERELASAMLSFNFIVANHEAENGFEHSTVESTLATARGAEQRAVRALCGVLDEWAQQETRNFSTRRSLETRGDI